MTVQVVGHAPEVEREAVCPGCGAKLRYVPNDVRSAWEPDGEGGKDQRQYIRCPQCRKQVTVNSFVRVY